MANKGVNVNAQKNQKKTIVSPENNAKTITSTSANTSNSLFEQVAGRPLVSSVPTTPTQTTSLLNQVQSASNVSNNAVNKAAAKTPTMGGVSKNTTQGTTPVKTINPTSPIQGAAMGGVAQTKTGKAAALGATGLAAASNPSQTTQSLMGALLGGTPTVGAGTNLTNAALGLTGTGVANGNMSVGDALTGAYGGGVDKDNWQTIASGLGSVLTPALQGTIGGQAIANNRNNARRAVNMQDALERAAKDALVNGNEDDLIAGEIQDLKPYTEVPFAGSLYSTLLGNSSPVVDTNRLPDENKYVNRVMENSVRNYLESKGIPGTYSNNVYEHILNPASMPINEALRDIATNSSNTSNTTNGGGSNGGSGSYGSSVRGGLMGALGNLDLGTLYDLFNQRLNEYDNNYNSLMDALMEMYGANSANLEDSYAALLNALGLNYSDSAGLLRSQYENSQAELENSRRRQLQEAYISRMMQQKNLADQLDALGLTGGASETLLGSLLNNYANNRANVEEQIRTSLRDLLNGYMTNQNSARQKYNDALINAQQRQLNARQDLLNNLYNAQTNALNTRANMRNSAYDDLFSTLANLAAKGYQI